MSKPSVQDMFDDAVKHSRETVNQLRAVRTGFHRAITDEQLEDVREAVREPSERSSSRIKVETSRSARDFDSTLALAKRLSNLGSSDEEGIIVCLGNPQEGGNPLCEGIKSFWRRAGKTPPEVMFVKEPLTLVLQRSPIAILIPLDVAPDESPDGYLKITLGEPRACILIREAA